MYLNKKDLKNREVWLQKDYVLPDFDIDRLIVKTHEDPIWLHFGAGNIFRAFLARLQQELLNKGRADRGIIVGETYDPEIINNSYEPYDNLSISYVKKMMVAL